MKCHHCGKTSINESMIVIVEITKPKGFPNRKKKTGMYCCEDCYDKGKPIRIDEYGWESRV